MMPDATVGLRSKTGRAIAVALHGKQSAPEFVLREEIALADDATRQPYHDVMELPWSESVAAVRPAIEMIRNIAIRSLEGLISAVHARGFDVAAIAVVGPGDRALERIGNPHIRAHAAEGVLFRRVLEEAAAAMRLRCRGMSDPASEIGRTRAEITRNLARLGRAAGPPWRSDEKAAATAAWIALGR